MALMKMKRNLLGIISFQENSKANQYYNTKATYEFLNLKKSIKKINKEVVDRIMAEAVSKNFPQDGDQPGSLPEQNWPRPSKMPRRRRRISKRREKYNQWVVNRVMAESLLK